MTEIDKVIEGLEWCINETHCGTYCPYWNDDNKCRMHMEMDALALLKAQEVDTVEPKRIELADETKVWLDKMDAVDILSNIADICIDWDGYRTADGLGGLVNEIWAYARYCAKRLAKAQEPMKPKKVNRYIDFDGEGHPYNPETYDCGACRKELPWKANYCPNCGRAVKWE